jgi:flagellar hook-length control protein FliK
VSPDAASDGVTSEDGDAPAAAAPSQQPAVLVYAAPIAAPIAAPQTASGGVAAPPPSATASEPLAIAAAAIAISKAPLEAANRSSGAPQAIIPSAVPDAPEPAGPAPADLASIKTAAPVATDAALAVTAAASTEQASTPAAAPDPTAVAAIAAGVTPKVAAKTPAAKIAGIAAPSEHAGDDADTTSPQSMAGAKTIAAQGPAVEGNQKTGGIPVESTKPDLPKTDATPTPHERHAAVQLQAEAIDAGPPTALQQPPPSAAAAAPAPQSSVTVSSSAAVPLDGLAVQIAVTAQSGRSRFEIRLDPAELGRIDVRIDVDRHGHMTSHLTVEKPETLAMLRQDAPQLQRALDNAGFKTGDNGLQFSLRDQPSSGQNGGDETNRNAQRLVISEDDGVAAAAAGRSYGRLSGSVGGVDIRV